jgi:pimeloyl-ACP methyl ester carboxylesterase
VSDLRRGRRDGANGGDGMGRADPTNGRVDLPRPMTRPVRKDEIVIEDRGLYVESWMPERRSRRKPLFLLHGELGGSWLWERYLWYFAQRGWEGHALNLRAHFWSDTAEFDKLDFGTYVDDVVAGYDAIRRPAVVVGHGMGGLLALALAEQRRPEGLVLLSPALPGHLRPRPPSHVARLVPAVFRGELIGWAGPSEDIQRQNPDLTLDDVARIGHLMGAESGKARRQMLEGIPVAADTLRDVPALVVGAGLDRLFPEPESERVASWLGAEYQPFGAHSHYGLVIGERSFEQVAETIRTFLESHRL